MKVYRTFSGILIENNQKYYLFQDDNWDQFINRDNLFQYISTKIRNSYPISYTENILSFELLPPILRQEVWAAGITYHKSKEARLKLASDSYYEQVYLADRPEILFKATPKRTSGHGEKVRLRKDSAFNVPEPELVLFVNSSGAISGYTIGNDMNSKSLEGENPLYIPQAKTYDKSASLGPCVLVCEEPIPSNTCIQMEIVRDRKVIFKGESSLEQMRRSFDELVEYLYRECTFEYGAFLMTGTGITLPEDFTLISNDEIRISIDHIGTLVNYAE